MNSVRSSVQSLMQMFDGKTKDFINDIETVDMVWLEEIQQEANRMFSRDFNAEPELMPKTPSQKKNSRRKRVSVGRQEESQTRRRFSKGKRSNLRRSSVTSLNFIAEEQAVPEASTSDTSVNALPKRTTRKNKQIESEVAEDVSELPSDTCATKEEEKKKPEVVEDEEVDKNDTSNDTEVEPDNKCSEAPSLPQIPSPDVVVSITSAERLSAELAKKKESSPGRTAAKIPIAGTTQSTRRSLVRHSLKLRHSLAGMRQSMTQESVRRASRRSMLKRKAARAANSTFNSNVDEGSSVEEEEREEVLEAASADTEDNTTPEESPEIQNKPSVQPAIVRVTRSVAAHSLTLASPLLTSELTVSTPNRKPVVTEKQQLSKSGSRSRQSSKRKAPDTVEDSPTKWVSPPKKSQSAIKPNMKSFLHTVQKNQMLMMTPNSLGRTGVIKSFIKHTTPLKTDFKLSVGTVTKERHKLEALKKKQEQEEERMKKMEEEKKRKQEELKRKRDERLRRVFEAKVKEEQREEEKKKKIEQKMAQIDEKNDKRMAEEKAKKKVALKRQEELEQKKKLEEEARKKKLAEEEKRLQDLLAKKKAEEEQQARKLAEARRAEELKREQERERQAAAERERVEKEKALALQREVERAAREKERRELEERRRALEEKRKMEELQKKAAEEKAAKEREAARQREAAAKQAAEAKAALNVTVDIERSVMTTPGKGAGLNVTVDIEQSPQSYAITPKGGDKPLVMPKSKEDYGMDQNSDDSTDDESAPRKPIPSWAEGQNLQQIIMKQYFNPPDLNSFFGVIEPPKLENIFYKSKPRYFKRTSSAVWHSPPMGSR
ncbi:inner centromere protein B isoform X1 [Xyrichtys novacula]|uniref:Inner centromere protein B isoform X1 n=1 Tax=Xyrichtys novacula TaxID=13765 RepID=A0AAV1F665_XYRNO|nr:inner centromere protein B isoform X1 [Xyrichtys novacula]